jgi:hypothetical protein
MKINSIAMALIFVTNLTAQNKKQIPDGWDTVKYPIKEVIYQEAKKKIVMEGTYTGKNLFIKNPFGVGGLGFCVHQVKVNGNTVTDEINAEIFQVDLSLHPLKVGDPIKVEIFHKDVCQPFVMNPNVFKPMANSMMIQAINIGQSLFVMNPRSSDGKTFSVKEVYVDGKKVTTRIDANVFELDFYKLGIKFKAQCKVEFKYESGYDPFLVNPDMLL